MAIESEMAMSLRLRKVGVFTVAALLASGLAAIIGAGPASARPGLGTLQHRVGDGTSGSGGDGGSAYLARITDARAVVETADGTMYIADDGSGEVRQVVGSTGKIYTYAGTGVVGFSGDNGPATAAKLGYIGGLALDHNGNLFIADTLNNRIRRVDSVTHRITTVAGNGTAGFFGDGGAATAAHLNQPNQITFDHDGNLLIADSSNNRIRKINGLGIISTIAGTGVASFSGDNGAATSATLDDPRSVVQDVFGNLFVADHGNDRVRRITPAGVIHTYAGSASTGFGGDGGPATSAKLDGPVSVTVDQFGVLYIADRSNNRIRSVDTSGNIHTVAGNGTAGDSVPGTATSSPLGNLSAVYVDVFGYLYVGQTGRLDSVVVNILTGNQAFVTSAELDFVSQLPVPSYLASVTAGLDGGTLTRGSFLTTLANSSQWISAIVNRLYVDTLGRPGDSSGVGYWVGQIQTHTRTVAEVAALFYASNEYYNGFGAGDPGTWLTDLYHKLLGRSPDSSGLSYWEGQITATSRSSVAYRFYQSLESRLARVAALYQHLLGRTPDSGGATYWAGRIQTEGDIALAINLASSSEYYDRASFRYN